MFNLRSRISNLLNRKVSLLHEGATREEKASIARYWLDKAYYDCLPYVPPVRLDISITTACNANCAYCWQQEKSGSRLNFDLVARIIDEICSLKTPRLLLTGGEPTIWSDFEQVLAYAKNVGINSIFLCTNGLRLSNFAFAERIVNLGITAISVSVDTFNPEKFRMLRGYSLSEIEKTLCNCIVLKKKYPSLNISLCSVMLKAVTPEELFEVRKFCDKHSFGYFIQSFDNTHYPEINRRFMLNPKERQIYNKKLAWLKGRVGEVVKKRHHPLTEGDGVKCYKGITTIKLASDGSIAFCWNSEAIGNILQDSFLNIWTSAKAKEMREFIRDKRCKCPFDCDVFESLELYDFI